MGRLFVSSQLIPPSKYRINPVQRTPEYVRCFAAAAVAIENKVAFRAHSRRNSSKMKLSIGMMFRVFNIADSV